MFIVNLYILLSNIAFFKVHKLNGDLSNHCQLSAMINVNIKIADRNISNLIQLPSQYIWNDNSAQLFQDALSSTEIKQKIIQFNECDFSNNTELMINNLNLIYN